MEPTTLVIESQTIKLSKPITDLPKEVTSLVDRVISNAHALFPTPPAGTEVYHLSRVGKGWSQSVVFPEPLTSDQKRLLALLTE